ncbi:MAG: tetratricopeptide repeat protein, partial [Limnobacter sp.]|nr:tetratricopeptide repeat protein [Limnobacter sp.]
MDSHKKTAKRVLSAFAVTVLASCATAPSSDQTGRDSESSATEQDANYQNRMIELVEADPLFAAMAAELAAQKGDLNSSTLAYTEAAKYLNDPELAKRAVELNLSAGDAELALQAAQVWSALAPLNQQASQSVMLLQLSTNRVEQAMPAVQTYLASLRTQNDESAGTSPLKAALDLMLRIPDKEKAYATGLDLIGNNPDLTEEQFVLSQLADAADKPEQAIEHLANVIEQVPEERYNVLMAQFLEKRDGNTGSAVEYLAARAASNPDWFSARLYLARIHTQDGNWDAAYERFKELIRLQPTNYGLYSSQGFVLTKLGKTDAAGRHFEIYLDKTPPSERQNETLIYMSMAELHTNDQNYLEALQWLNRAPLAEQNLDIQLKTHLVYKSKGDMAMAAQVLERFKPQNEEETVRLTLARSQFVEDMEQPDQAIEALNAALDQYPDQEDLLYERAMVAERQQDLESVEKYLRRLIEVRPQNPHGYNALGYTFAERGIRLEEAMNLIKKANELAPRDPYILDSLGWVYYKLGEPELAEQHLLAAFSIRQDEEIGTHLLELY